MIRNDSYSEIKSLKTDSKPSMYRSLAKICEEYYKKHDKKQSLF